jgi:hypothetical protein
MSSSIVARYAWRAILAACVCLVTYATYQPLIHRVVDVDANGWPLGAPAPACPQCGELWTGVIPGREPLRRCFKCAIDFVPEPPKGW